MLTTKEIIDMVLLFQVIQLFKLLTFQFMQASQIQAED